MDTSIMYPDMSKPLYDMRGDIFHGLSEIDYTNLVHRYYNGETVKSLFDEYGIDASAQKFARQLPYFKVTLSCKYCDVLMAAQGDTSQKNGNVCLGSIAECTECGHKYHAKSERYKCNCANCKQYFEDILSDDIANSMESAKTPQDYLDAPHYIKLTLAAVLRNGQDEHDLELILPLFQGKKTKLAPTTEISADLISLLVNQDWIRFDEINNEDVFTIEDGEIRSYEPFSTRFRLNLNDGYHDISAMRSPTLDGFNMESALVKWIEIAIGECTEYLLYQLDQHNLPDGIGPKTITVIEEALKHYSVSQVFGMIWPAVRDAAAYYQRDRITKQHAVNTIAGTMQRKLDKAIVDGWDMKGYRRDYNLPQSIYSHLFSSRVLGDENKIYDEVIPARAFELKRQNEAFLKAIKA